MRRLVLVRHEHRLARIVQRSAYPRWRILDELGCLPLGPLPAPAGVSVTATTEEEQDEKDDQYGFHGSTSLMTIVTPEHHLGVFITVPG